MKTNRPPFSIQRAMILFAVLMFSPLTGIYPAEQEDGIEARQKFAKVTHQLFEQGKFDEIEKMAKELRVSKARFPYGRWKLHSLYDGLDPDNGTKNQAGWDAEFKKLDEWKKQFPNSITQNVARSRLLTNYAWAARGNGWGNTVTDNGWKLFSERLAQARTVLEEAKKLPEKCSEWFAAMQTVALGQDWDRAEYDRLFNEAVAFEPTYQEFYFEKAQYLLPRWYGKEGEWERFAEEAAKGPDKEEGMGIYARIAWGQTDYYSNIFKETRIEWPKMKQGFIALEKCYPNSPANLNAFCKFAAQAGDLETTAALLKRIGDHPMLKVWGTLGAFERAKAMSSGTSLAKPRATLTRPASGPCARSLAFSPDGKTLVVGYEDGLVEAFDVEKQKLIGMVGQVPESAVSVAFSPDGKLLAAAGGSWEPSSRGLVKIWKFPSRKEQTTIGDFKGTVSTVRFTPDGKTLVMTGGIYNRQGEARLWDVASGKVTDLDWAPKHTHYLDTAAISPDSRILAIDCNRSITVWDMVDHKSLFETKQTLLSWVWSLAFSPNGKLLAAGLSKGYLLRTDPGGIVLWALPDFVELSSGIIAHTSGILSIAFSPDSQLLIGGGYDGCVRVWQLTTGKEIATLYGHNDTIYAVAFSPDGKSIASAGQDGDVKLWDTPKP